MNLKKHQSWPDRDFWEEVGYVISCSPVTQNASIGIYRGNPDTQALPFYLCVRRKVHFTCNACLASPVVMIQYEFSTT